MNRIKETSVDTSKALSGLSIEVRDLVQQTIREALSQQLPVVLNQTSNSALELPHEVRTLIEQAIKDSLSKQLPSASSKPTNTALVRLVRSLGTACRYPAGAAIVGAPSAFFLTKITLVIMIFAVITGCIFGLAGLFFSFVADLVEESSE